MHLSVDAQQAEMFRTYGRTGGLASGDEVTLLLRKRTSQPISLLARWIATQRVVSFTWKGPAPVGSSLTVPISRKPGPRCSLVCPLCSSVIWRRVDYLQFLDQTLWYSAFR